MMTQLMMGDCLELMKNIPDGSIDMILCDLPYKETGNKWDKSFPLDKVCKEFERLSLQTPASCRTLSIFAKAALPSLS